MATGGLDLRRFDQVLAVLIKHAKLKLWDQDARINVVGAVFTKDPAADLAVAAAIVSSACEVAVPHDMAFAGEIGLGGARGRMSRPRPTAPTCSHNDYHHHPPAQVSCDG